MNTERAKRDYEEAVEARERLMDQQVSLMTRLQTLHNEKSEALAELRQKLRHEEAKLTREHDRQIEKQQGELRKLESQIRIADQKVATRENDLKMATENEKKDRTAPENTDHHH